jgi:predicted histidine transporter YuiF (NhaC family)
MSDPKGARSEVSDLVDLLKRYLLQETLAPLKTMGRTLGFGAAAAVTLGIGGTFALIGVLRVLETETGTVFGGNLSWVPYGLATLAGVAVIGLAGALLLRTPRSERSRGPESGVPAESRQEAG